MVALLAVGQSSKGKDGEALDPRQGLGDRHRQGGGSWVPELVPRRDLSECGAEAKDGKWFSGGSLGEVTHAGQRRVAASDELVSGAKGRSVAGPGTDERSPAGRRRERSAALAEIAANASRNLTMEAP